MSKRKIRLGNLQIGGGAPVVVQSMTNTDTRDAETTLQQIERLVRAGCEACRVAVPDHEAVAALKKITERATIPIIADIHFDWQLAIASVDSGCAGIRINPGNIGNQEKIAEVTAAVKANGAAMRIGVNSGSLEKDILARYGRPAPRALAESAVNNVRIIETLGLENIKVSIKSSSVMDTVRACEIFSEQCDYPLHIGITEAGPYARGIVKSAVGLGILLNRKIGDTIRVSLTAPPEDEVKAAWEILRSLGLRNRGPEIVSCPTCGRTEIDLFRLTEEVEKMLENCQANIKVAVMGCPVNGPGEARDADIGLAGGRGKGIIFRNGKIVAHARGHDELLHTFSRELEKILAEK